MTADSSQSLPPPPFLQREATGQLEDIHACVERVVSSGRFLFGDELEAFESALSQDLGVRFASGCGSGTDAIHLALLALGIGPGSKVVTQSHSSPFTVNAIWSSGARPVLIDSSPDDFGMSLEALHAALTEGADAIVVVHLYGHPVRISEICELAARFDVPVVEDCAQSHGAREGDRCVGTIGRVGCFSFYPTKNLGALGDGGAVVTDDASIDERVRLFRNGGLTSPGIHAGRGITSRLNEVQAAVLRLRLGALSAANERRREHARAYRSGLCGVQLPGLREGCTWAPHQFVIRHDNRDELRAAAAAGGVPLQVHYPLPIHLQDGYRMDEYPRGSLPMAERLAAEVLSLPTHPLMTDDERAAVVAAVNDAAAVLSEGVV